MKDSEFSLDDLKFTMRNMYVNGLHKSGRKRRGSAMTADAARRDKSGLKCHSCGKLGHFQRECTANTKKLAQTPHVHSKKFKPSKKGATSKTKWCSLHNTTSHCDAECKAQAAGKSSQDTSAQQVQGKGHNANSATEEKPSEEVTVSKDDLVGVMKRISSSLRKQDSATAQGSGNSMGFSFTDAQEQVLSASTNETVK